MLHRGRHIYNALRAGKKPDVSDMPHKVLFACLTCDGIGFCLSIEVKEDNRRTSHEVVVRPTFDGDIHVKVAGPRLRHRLAHIYYEVLG